MFRAIRDLSNNWYTKLSLSSALDFLPCLDWRSLFSAVQRIIRLGGAVDDDSCNLIVAQLLWLDAADPEKVIRNTNSPCRCSWELSNVGHHALRQLSWWLSHGWDGRLRYYAAYTSQCVYCVRWPRSIDGCGRIELHFAPLYNASLQGHFYSLQGSRYHANTDSVYDFWATWTSRANATVFLIAESWYISRWAGHRAKLQILKFKRTKLWLVLTLLLRNLCNALSTAP